MDRFLMFGLVACTAWVLLIIKLILDQLKLYRLYRKIVNPPFPLLPGEKTSKFPSASSSIFADTIRRVQISFKKYPKNAELNKLAAMVRLDVILMVAVLVVVAVSFYFVGA